MRGRQSGGRSRGRGGYSEMPLLEHLPGFDSRAALFPRAIGARDGRREAPMQDRPLMSTRRYVLCQACIVLFICAALTFSALNILAVN